MIDRQTDILCLLDILNYYFTFSEGETLSCSRDRFDISRVNSILFAAHWTFTPQTRQDLKSTSMKLKNFKWFLPSLCEYIFLLDVARVIKHENFNFLGSSLRMKQTLKWQCLWFWRTHVFVNISLPHQKVWRLMYLTTLFGLKCEM